MFSQEKPKSCGLEVVVVDDESDLSELIAEEFVFEQCTVHTAKNGTEALDFYLNSPRCDVLLADLRMPEMDGFELLAKLQAESKKSGRPMPLFILMTGYLDLRENDARAKGVDALFRKPFSIEDMVHYALEAHSRRQEIKQSIKQQNSQS